MSKKILLNCDMGESFGNWKLCDDKLAITLIDQCNLACGFHAGDFSVMSNTVALAVAHNVSIGAHPAYPDLQGFGRRSMQFAPQEITDLMLYQMGALDAFCRTHSKQIEYVKPHGGLYNDMVTNEALLAAAIKACALYRKGLPLMVLARQNPEPVLELADKAGVPILFEGFADRAYLADGRLSPRSREGSVHKDVNKILAQATAIAKGDSLPDIDGNPITIKADSLCVHGDNPESIEVLKQLRHVLDAL